MAKPIPLPLGLIAVLIPTTCPRKLKSGPPLLPGLIDASVWMKSSYGPGSDRARLGAYDPHRDRIAEPKRVADGDHVFTHAQLLARAE